MTTKLLMLTAGLLLAGTSYALSYDLTSDPDATMTQEQKLGPNVRTQRVWNEIYIQKYGVEPALRDPFFTAVRAIKSNYDRREVLTGLARKGSSSREVQDAVFAAVADMTSDYDRAETLLAFVPAMDAASRPAFVSAAERIGSAHDQNRVLAALVKSERR